MLVYISKKIFIQERVYDEELKIADLRILRDLPLQVKKFYKRRRFLFSKYSEGIKLDEESWYSVIPEVISQYVAQKVHQKLPNIKVIDGFCGSGGIGIQFALKYDNFQANDIDPIKTSNIQNNMKIYGKLFDITTSCFFNLQVDEPAILIICPPWGGTNYQEGGRFDLLTDMQPNFFKILKKALSLSQNLVIQLPKNIEIKQLVSIFQQVQRELNLQLSRFSLEIEQMYVNEKLDQLIAYFGDIAQPDKEEEIRLLKNKLNIQSDSYIKNYINQKGIVDLYKQMNGNSLIILSYLYYCNILNIIILILYWTPLFIKSISQYSEMNNLEVLKMMIYLIEMIIILIANDQLLN